MLPPALLTTLFSTVFSQLVALPTDYESKQVVIEGPRAQREYENGELPPVENTSGWVDPRLNGGRLLDVSPLYQSFFSRTGNGA